MADNKIPIHDPAATKRALEKMLAEIRVDEQGRIRLTEGGEVRLLEQAIDGEPIDQAALLELVELTRKQIAEQITELQAYASVLDQVADLLAPIAPEPTA
jgi:hypothetical protein